MSPALATVALLGLSTHLAAGLIAEALILGGCLLVEVDLPDGGSVPLGHTLVIAFAVLLPPGRFAAVTFAALAMALPLWAARRGRGVAKAGSGPALLALIRIGAAAAAAAGVVALTIDGAIGQSWPHGAAGHLLRTVAAGAAYLAVESPPRSLARRLLRPARPLGQAVDIEVADEADLEPTYVRRAADAGWLVVPGVYAALVCSAALLVIVYHDRGPWAALLVAVPLAATKVSFSRYAEARRIHEQVVRALGVLSEVSGLTPLGHSERTASYAGSLALAFELDPARTRRVMTAARLHHIGLNFDGAAFAEPPASPWPVGTGDPWRPADEPPLGCGGAEVLRETGFLAEVAGLVEASAGPAGGGLEAAIVRVASSFDDLLERHDGDLDPASIGLLCNYPSGIERSVALTLLQQCDRRPMLIVETRGRCGPAARLDPMPTTSVS